MRKRKWLQVTILLMILVIGGYTIISGLFNEKNTLPNVGDLAPNFALTDLDGNVVQLADFEGQAIMLNFWGTFCEPCVTEMPLFQEYYEKFQDEGFTILGVNLHEPPVTVRRFVKEHGLTFPIVLDKTVISKQYGVRVYPTTFFINRDGMIEHKIDMLIDDRRLQPLVAQILK